MAIFRGTAVITELAGSIGDRTWWRARGGIREKARVAPTNPNTIKQIRNRLRLASCVAQWQAMTDEQRFKYNVIAKQHFTRSRLGHRSIMNGYLLFMRQNILAPRVIGSIFTDIDPPTATDYGRSITARIIATGNICEFETSCDIFTSQAKLIFYINPPRPLANKSFNPSSSILVGISSLFPGISVNDLEASFTSNFGAISTHIGKRVSIGLTTYYPTQGILTRPQYIETIVQP